MPNRRNKKKWRNFVENLRVQQRNNTWPGFILGGRGVDSALLKSSQQKPFIQRIGGVLLGAWLACSGFMALGALDVHPLAILVLSPIIFFGAYTIWVAVRNR